ncbi:MAG: protoheme IX farnesyltransferase [Acidobacteria bacterium]|nr:protoheme IX farnesyltransferase [Acidobacteriota bacterium]
MFKRITGAEAVSTPLGAWQIGLGSRSGLSDYLELTKPRVTTLVLLTTLVGFYLGSSGPMHFWLLLHTLLGTGLTAGGSSALNQFLERRSDKRMRRTENRPLPSGRVDPAAALLFGIALATTGLAYLALRVNTLSALLALGVLCSYLFLYTPLKQKTSLCTVVGAFPGATPPVIGWAGACGALDWKAATLFLILYLWQFPHFLAIAWMYRDDYEKGGLCMLPLQDREGFITSQQILIYIMTLIPVSLLPSLLGIAGVAYLFGALILGILFLYYGFRVAQSRSSADARRLLKASVLYLPLLLALMVVDKT